MAMPLSNEEVLASLMGDKTPLQDSLLNQVSDSDRFLNQLEKAGTGLLSNYNNLTGNIADEINQSGSSATAQLLYDIKANEETNLAEKVWEGFKSPFTDTDAGAINQIFGENFTQQLRDSAQKKSRAMDAKNELAQQYSGGGLGQFAGDIVTMLPIAKFGRMSRTNSAITQGATKLQTAKAVGADALENAGVLSSTEFLLGKAYGQSDAEATANALMAGGIGLVGTPLLGAGKAFMHATPLEKAQIKLETGQALTDEDMAILGGGIKTKSGREFEAPKVEESKRAVENVEYDVVEPKAEVGKPIPDQTFVPEVNNPKKISYGYDDRGRVYTEESSLLSPQGASTEKASFKQKAKPEVENAKAEVDRRLEFFDRDEQLRQRYGQAQAKTTEKRTSNQTRDSFEKDQYKSIRDDKSLPREVRSDASAKLKELNSKANSVNVPDGHNYSFVSPDGKNITGKVVKESDDRIVVEYIDPYSGKTRKSVFNKKTGKAESAVDVNHPELASKTYSGGKKIDTASQKKSSKSTDKEANKRAKAKLDEQTSVESKTSYTRQNKLSDEYKAFVKAKGTPRSTVTDEITAKSITEKAESKLSEVKKAIRKVTIAEKQKAKDFDISNITASQRKAYRDDIALIEDYTGAKQDLNLFHQGKLSGEELRYREGRRIDDRISRSGEQQFKTDEEAIAYKEATAKEYRDVGIEVKDDIKMKKEAGTGTEKPEKKAERESKEIAEAQRSNEFLQKALAQARRTGENPKYKSGEKAGQPRLTESQFKDARDKILTIGEIADKTIPVVIKGKRTGAIKQARDLANKRVSDKQRELLGIDESKKLLPKDINFKDTTIDASNSIMQIISVILGSKRLAKLSKLYGGEDDIRSIIGKTMEKNGLKMPKVLGSDGKEMSWKELVKPLFMTENYGQGRKGLVRNIMKEQKVNRIDAEKFLAEYNKASDMLIPEMVELRDLIYKHMDNNQNGTFKWTLPDGFKVEFKLTRRADGTISMRGKNIPFKVETGDLDDFSRALMPNLIHSIDAYVARRMNKEGIPTTHDALTVPKGMEQKAKDAYTEVMVELNESSILHDIMKELGYKGTPKKVGDLESSAIEKSEYKLSVEHEAGIPEVAKVREFDVSKQNTKEEVMRDFMASGNVRNAPTNQLIDSMVTEAGYRTMSVARDSDDVFERQIALAHQSAKYNPKQALSAPEGVNKKAWDATQERIFNESRAKLEYNPLLNDVLQGERKYFKQDGSIVGGKFESMEAVLKKEQEAIEKMGEDPKTYAKKKAEAYSYKQDQELTNEQLNTRAQVDAVTQETYKDTNAYKTLWDEQNSASPKFKEFTELENVRNIHKSDVDRKVEVLFDRLKTIPKEKQAKLKVLMDSDYEAINGMTKAQADEMWTNHKALLDIVGKEVEQTAKGIGKKSEQYGYYLNNPHLIAKRYGLDSSAEQAIDKLISIRAMELNDAWKVVDELQGDVDMKFVLDTMAQKRHLSEQFLFANNSEKIVKGFQSEVYRGQKRIDKDGKVRWDAESMDEMGIVGRELENKKVGTVYNKDVQKFNNLEDELEFMTKNRLKKGPDVNGKSTYRYIAEEDIRLEAGKVDDLANTLSETVRSVSQKVKDRGLILRVLDTLERDESLLFSKTQKPGMTKLGTDELQRLPYDLRDTMQYVDKELVAKLIGRDEVRLINTKLARKYKLNEQQWAKVSDRLLNNFGTMFKQNVVLKNASSYVNSFLVNQSYALAHGISPKKMLESQTAAMRDMKELDDILNKLSLQQITGAKRDKILNDKLKNNLLWKMERAGLSTNRVEGVVGDNDLLSGMFKDMTEKAHIPAVFTAGQYVTLNQKTPLGRGSLKLFSVLDTSGRYMIAKKHLDDGMDIKSAVHEANGIYGNMDKMVPETIELVDKYGFIPFAKWFSLTAPKLLQHTRNNPKKAFALAVVLYAFGQETDTNVASFNPLQGMADFFESSTIGKLTDMKEMGVVYSAKSRAMNTVLPNYITSYTQDPMGGIWRDIRKPKLKGPFRGITQKIIEGD